MLKGRGYESILLWVLASNHPARRFYEKHGFTDTNISQTITIAEKPFKELLYTRQTSKRTPHPNKA